MNPALAKWVRYYPDEPTAERVTVAYDIISQHLPHAISVETNSGFPIYIDLEDAEWVAARILDAAQAIRELKK